MRIIFLFVCVFFVFVIYVYTTRAIMQTDKINE